MNFLKYPGGKERELKFIKPILPNFKNYYEPFVGGGSVYLDMVADHYFINDKSNDLMNIYQCIQNQDQTFYSILNDFQSDWSLISETVKDLSSYILNKYNQARSSEEIKIDDLFENDNWLKLKISNKSHNQFIKIAKQTVNRKINRMLCLETQKGKLIESDIIANIEGSLKSAFYTVLRNLYNTLDSKSSLKTAAYLFLRETCYSSMFRFNSKGEFNVPYGGLSYNDKKLNAKVDFYSSEYVRKKMAITTLCNEDFADFIAQCRPSSSDFMFLDPPYDSDFSTYDQNVFGEKDQRRLSEFLINECPCKFLLIIKNTELINKLYKSGQKCANGLFLNIRPFSHQYLVSFKNRNNKNTNHLLIGNFNFN